MEAYASVSQYCNYTVCCLWCQSLTLKLIEGRQLVSRRFSGHVQYTPKPVHGFVFRRPLGQVPPKMVFLRMVCGSQPEPLLEWMLCDCLPAAKYGNCMQGNCFLHILVLYIKSIGATFLDTLLRLSLLSFPELQYLLCCG